MRPASRPVGRLLVTGVPGWLTDALLRSLRDEPLPGLTGIRCMVQPGVSAPGGPPSHLGVPVEHVEADLRDTNALAAATRGVDTVFHAAGILHVRQTRDWYSVNTQGTINLLKAATSARIGRFVLISSNAAAGKSPRRDHLLTESESPQPLSHYGRSKWLAEQAVLATGAGIEPVVLRPCMFYGPPVPARHVDVYRRILNGRMPLVGSGDYARSVSYIDNLVQGCRLSLTHPAAVGQTYYISDRPAYTTKQVVEAMAEALGVAPRFLPVPRIVAPIAYDVDMWLARGGRYWQTLHLVGEADWHVGVSCEKARRELGYEPTVELEEGMRRAVAWCRSVGALP